jgi:hypothetical protein
MAISKDTTARNAACNAIVDLLDQGVNYTTGHLSIYNSDMTRITWHQLSNPAFGDATDGTSYANLIGDATALLDATANSFNFENRDGSSIWSGDITMVGGGGSLELDSTVIPQDTTVTIAYANYIVPA